MELHKQSPEVFYKKDVLKNSAKFTGKHLGQSLYFSKKEQLFLKLHVLWMQFLNTF